MESNAAIEVIDLDSTDDESSEMKPNISTMQTSHNSSEIQLEPNQAVSNQKAEVDKMLSTFMDLHSKLVNREQLMDPIQRLRWLNILTVVKQTGTNEPDALLSQEEEEEDENEEEEEAEDTQTTQARRTERPDVYYKSPRQEPLYVERLWTEPSTRQRTYKRKKKSYKRKPPKKAPPRARKAASTTAPSFQKAKQAATRMHNQIIKAKNHIKKNQPKSVSVKKESNSTIRIKSERRD